MVPAATLGAGSRLFADAQKCMWASVPKHRPLTFWDTDPTKWTQPLHIWDLFCAFAISDLGPAWLPLGCAR